MRTACRCALMFLTVLMMGLNLSVAQNDRGMITGTVKDASGAVLPGAPAEEQRQDDDVVEVGDGEQPGRFGDEASDHGRFLFLPESTGYPPGGAPVP